MGIKHQVTYWAPPPLPRPFLESRAVEGSFYTSRLAFRHSSSVWAPTKNGQLADSFRRPGVTDYPMAVVGGRVS